MEVHPALLVLAITALLNPGHAYPFIEGVSPTVNRNGKEYATLDGANPHISRFAIPSNQCSPPSDPSQPPLPFGSSDSCGNQNQWLPLPYGWSIASHEDPDSFAVAGNNWATCAVTFGPSGIVHHFAVWASCGTGGLLDVSRVFIHETVINGTVHYAVNAPTMRILMVRTGCTPSELEQECGAFEACTKSEGAVVCTCLEGFSKDEMEGCVDLDECALGVDDCHTNASCSNQIGSYSCECEQGYVGNGTSCSDQDECALGTDNCDESAECINTPGAFQCTCPKGLVRKTSLGTSICVVPKADPGFPASADGKAATAIQIEQTQGALTHIEIELFNYGIETSTRAQVEVAVKEWGVTYGGWQAIGRIQYDAIVAGDSVVQSLSHIFDNRALNCFQAKIIDAGAGGNADTSNDQTELNVNVVHTGPSYDMWIPFANAADSEIVVEATQVLCILNGQPVSCEEARIHGAPGQNGTLPDKLPANSEVVAHVEMPVVPKGGMTVVVVSLMNGEPNHVAIQMIRSSVGLLLDTTHLCCVRSVRTRVRLESLAADALDAYEQGQCKSILRLLRMLVQTAIRLECELEDEEVLCIEIMLLKMVDAGIMAVSELMSGGGGITSLQEAHMFRTAGLYEAALLAAAKGC